MSKKPTYNELEQKIKELEKKNAYHRLLEKHKKELEAQLQKNFAAGIAHDFNNLLMAIQANVSLMLLDTDPSDKHYERLNSIEKNIQSGARLTSRLLIQAKEEKFEIRSINLNQMIDEASESFCKTRQGIDINRDLDEDLYMIKANSGQMEQMLFNLFAYAANNMENGGTLSIATANTSHGKMQDKKYQPKPGNYVLVTLFSDNLFIEGHIIKHIFDPLFTSMEIKQGTDLSLASIYGTVKSYGGYVDVECAEDRGTYFYIYLPATRKKAKKLIQTAEKFIKERGTILLVDDEEVFLDLGQELLEAMGYIVLKAKNGREAVEIFQKKKDRIGLVILDIVMPIMAGGETFDRLKKINPDVKVLLASGYSLEGEASKILKRGCNDFIQKPFTIKELSKKITELVVRG